jgi:hypothetical protein
MSISAQRIAPAAERVVFATEQYGDVDLRCYKERFRRRFVWRQG